MTTETYHVWDLIVGGLVAIGTLALAVLAVYQDRIRAWLDAPMLGAELSNEPPDCVWVPLRHTITGQHVADTIHIRFRVANTGKSSARRVEVYANGLEEFRNGQWHPRRTFPPMNLNWADVGGMYFSSISPQMAKHCDFGHVIDPAALVANPNELRNEINPALNLRPNQACFAFAVVAQPFHQGHIVGPGRYRLTIILAAENAHPRTETIEVELMGQWYPDEARMLRDGIRVAVV